MCLFIHVPFPQQHLFLSPVFSVLQEFEILDVQFLEASHTCGSHHNLTCEDIAMDIVKHAEVHVDTLQPCGLCVHSLGCIDDCALRTSSWMAARDGVS